MAWKRCTGKDGNSCTNINGKVVINANWRWLHIKDEYANCYDGCLENCSIEGADYQGTYGITAGNDSLTPKFITKVHLYLMKDTNNYEMFTLVGNDFTFDVDLSQLSCGINGALYFVSMPQKGHGTPGAKYGTSYCDAQCARWQPSANDPNAGLGMKGARCAEMDI
ncbi:glycoside hydrolase family 7 protein [Pleomassaria siparia CBS 279.74]|uniref:cellulose 1,4-beta-cellobiosidase (non-reducing end) n=1 Tax=Pleomassaria siparia CBS 279.74 TaxID=1314801 RepID=A0A6G1K090_9PLEO|nr:glycoside hydrolase family 7 protein [Pleomassaria siparia CBS 279.74]